MTAHPELPEVPVTRMLVVQAFDVMIDAFLAALPDLEALPIRM